MNSANVTASPIRIPKWSHSRLPEARPATTASNTIPRMSSKTAAPRMSFAVRVLSTRTAKLILGAAVFDDILGMVLLAVVAGLASGSLEWLHLGILIGEAVTFALFMI